MQEYAPSDVKITRTFHVNLWDAQSSRGIDEKQIFILDIHGHYNLAIVA